MTAQPSRDAQRLVGVHPDLQTVYFTAKQRIQEELGLEVFVTEGVRTQARQKALVAAGASRTLTSRHLTGHALDYAVKLEGEVRWDWPPYRLCADVFKQCAEDLGIPIVAGADWVKFRDGPHIELDRRVYP